MENYPTSDLERNNCSPESLMRAKMRAEELLSPIIEVMDTLSEQLGKPVVLAGGAVRDALLERTIKDYDIFVSAAALDQEEGDAWMNGRAFGAFLSYCIGEALDLPYAVKAPIVNTVYDDDETSFGSEVKAIWDFTVQGDDIQLIFLRKKRFAQFTARAFVRRLDFGLCKVAISSDRQWIISDEFLQDVCNREMTLCRADSDEDVARSMRRAKRLYNKYPGYSTVIPANHTVEG